MKQALKLVLTVAIFYAVAGLLLAWTNNVTNEKIEAVRKAEFMLALKRALPECDNDIVADAKVFHEGDKEWTFYVARLKGKFTGAAFCSVSEHGYGGLIKVLVGVKSDGTIKDVEILLAEKETPDLGSKIREAKFRDQFKGKSAVDTKWAAVTNDGGEVEGITGATISSRAVTEAVKAGLDIYAKHATEIAGAR